MKKTTIGILTVALSLLVGCSKGEYSSSSQVKDTSPAIIKVNDASITKNQFDKVFNRQVSSSFLASRNMNIKDSKNKFIYLIYKDRVINDLIIKTLISQEAQKHNIKVSDDDVNKSADEIAQKLGGKDKLDTKLTLANVEKKDFYEDVKLDLTIRKLVDSLAVGMTVSDVEAQNVYNKLKATKFTNPDMVRAKHILISASESEIKSRIEAENANLPKDQVDKKVKEEMAKAKAKAENILAQLKTDPSKFDELAKKNSEDPSSAEKGGDLGFFSKGDMVPEFSKVAFSTTPGKVSDVVKTDFGYHIIKVIDRKKPGVTPFAEVKKDITKYMLDQKKMEIFQKLVENSKNSAKVTYLDKQYDLSTIQNEIKVLAKTQKLPMNQQAQK